MPCPTPAQFAALVIDPSASACEALSKLGPASVLWRDAYGCIYNADGSFTTEFIAKICATGCAGGGGIVTTTTGGVVSTTTGGPVVISPQNYSVPGDYAFTIPSGVTQVTVTVIAGGGSGALASPFGDNSNKHAGGGSGEMRVFTTAVTPGGIMNVTVGAGSSGSTGQGQAGGQSVVVYGSSNVSAVGGGGGSLGVCYNTNPPTPGPAYPGGAGGSGGSGGIGTSGIAGSATSPYPSCGNGAGGASVGLGAGAGSAGSSNTSSSNPGGHGYVRIAW